MNVTLLVALVIAASVAAHDAAVEPQDQQPVAGDKQERVARVAASRPTSAPSADRGIGMNNDKDQAAKVQETLRPYIERSVAGGFEPADHIAEDAVEAFADDFDPDLLKSHAERLTREALEAHRLAQQQWPPVTDCDRLDAAFAELESAGIVCRQNFSCCGTCGAGEIVDEMQQARDAGREVRGYAFYHMQDTESAVEGYGLCLSYGSVLRGEKAALGVADEIVRVLNRHGLKAKWDGTWERRIEVPMNWKRRRS